MMPRGDKSKYTEKQKTMAEHIEEGYEHRGVPVREAERLRLGHREQSLWRGAPRAVRVTQNRLIRVPCTRVDAREVRLRLPVPKPLVLLRCVRLPALALAICAHSG